MLDKSQFSARTHIVAIMSGAQLYFSSNVRTPVGDLRMLCRAQAALEILATVEAGIADVVGQAMHRDQETKVTIHHASAIFGEAMVRKWGAHQLPPAMVKNDPLPQLEVSKKECVEELRKIRSKHNPKGQAALLYSLGSEQYRSDVTACLRRYFPSPISRAEIQLRVSQWLHTAKWQSRISTPAEIASLRDELELLMEMADEGRLLTIAPLEEWTLPRMIHVAQQIHSAATSLPSQPREDSPMVGLMRDFLTEVGVPSDGAVEATPSHVGPPVVLQGPAMPVLVMGIQMPKLTQARYRLIEKLIAAGENGCTKDSIEKAVPSARAMLKEMRKDPHWKQVIHLAGSPGSRYRIANPTPPLSTQTST